MPNDAAAIRLAGRSISLRCILEQWSHSQQLSEFHATNQNYIASNANYVADLCSSEKSFRITVETFNRHFSQTEKVEKIETFGYLPATGTVNLKTPQVHWYYIEYYGTDPLNIPEQPLDMIFGRWVRMRMDVQFKIV